MFTFYVFTISYLITIGSDTADQIIGILLKTNMFVGGFIGCLLDNTIPGEKNFHNKNDSYINISK